MIMTLQVRVADEGEPGVEPQGGPAADPGAETEHRAPSRRQGGGAITGRGILFYVVGAQGGLRCKAMQI